MATIIIAVLLALSLVGGGVVYAAEAAPTISPLHPVRETVNTAAHTLSDTASSLTTNTSKAQGNSGHQNQGKGQNPDDATATPTPTGSATATMTPTATATPVDTTTPTITPTRTITPTPTFTATPLASTNEPPAISTMQTEVTALATDPAVPGNSENGLSAKLDAAANAISRGDSQTAANILNAVAHQLNAMERSGHITQANYDALYQRYLDLLASLNTQTTPVPTVTPHANAAGHATSNSATSQEHGNSNGSNTKGHGQK